MSGNLLSYIFLAQRRGGAEKKSSEPCNSPDHRRQGFEMRLSPPSFSPRLCASARKIKNNVILDTNFPEEPGFFSSAIFVIFC